MSRRPVARFFQRTLPIASVLALLFIALYSAGDATQGDSTWSQYYQWIFPVAGIALFVLAVAVLWRLINLVRRRRAGHPGARLTQRMVLMFVALAVPPALIVYWFSVDFLNRSIDQWFDVDVATALEDAQAIGVRFLELQKIEKNNLTARMAQRLADISNDDLASPLRALVAEGDALEMTVLGNTGRVIRTSSRDLGRFTADLPSDLQLLQARQRGSFVDYEPNMEEDGSLQVRVLHAIPDRGLGPERVLQGIFEVPQGFDEQASNVELQYLRYQSLKFQRKALKQAFVLILSMVLTLSVLLALLLAFNTARRLVHPISNLAEATRSIAGGDYQRRLPVPSNDELGFLVQSFNLMTEEIERSTDEASRSRREAEARRDFLETVLGSLTSGVITLTSSGVIQAVNQAAQDILGVDDNTLRERTLSAVAKDHLWLTPLADLAVRNAQTSHRWREEITLEGEGDELVLTCRGARLPMPDDSVGTVLVFEDMTDLARAQREAAWGEVARRLAHEVKNPLTPIQLSAERLRHKYLGKMPEKDAEVLDRATRTIVSQVEALKTMVNAFSDYARAPTLQLEPLRLSELVEEMMEFYQAGDRKMSLTCEWMEQEPRVFADRLRLRQLLHNLIKNAQEANDAGALKLNAASHLEWQRGAATLCLSLRDNGPGLPPDIQDKMFEPYATSKSRGTGIGLAIVKKIAEEHGGDISARNAEKGGAVFELRLPVEVAELASAPPEQSQISSN
ncbi:MAG: ATP-binding protein [Lysobacterales bacterium]